MAEALIKEETLTAIADKIREKAGVSDTYKPQEMADGVEDVYDAGRQAEYDAFWDQYQTNGARKLYYMAFASVGWNNKTFKPKYSMKPTRADNMFCGCAVGGSLTKTLEECGVTLSFENATKIDSCFAYSSFSLVGAMDTRSEEILTRVFEGTIYLATIEKLILKEDGTQKFVNVFLKATALKNITIDGVIGKSVSFSDSPLSKTSIINVVSALSGSVSGNTLTLKKTAVNDAFGIDVDDATTWGEGTEYYELRHSKNNWTFSYA